MHTDFSDRLGLRKTARFLVLIFVVAMGCKESALMYYTSDEGFEPAEYGLTTISAHTDGVPYAYAFYILDESVPCIYGETEYDDCVNFRSLQLDCEEEEAAQEDLSSSTIDYVELATYENQEACIDDMSGVVDGFSQTGTIEAGPNGDTSGSGSGSGGSGGGEFVCESSFGDGQLDPMCCTAGSYQHAGHSEGQSSTCAALEAMLDCCYTGTATCPYC